jgi:hypothetical protein
MSRLDLSPEERALLARYARGADEGASLLFFYVVVLIPPIAFSVYGLIRRDPIALVVAFGSLLCLVIWRVWSDFGSGRVFNSLMKKVSEFEASQNNVGGE